MRPQEVDSRAGIWNVKRRARGDAAAKSRSRGPCSPGGSSRHGFTFPLRYRERYVDPWPRYDAPDGLPAHDSMTNISLPSPGSPRSRFPCFNGTMKMCDSLRPSRRVSFCFAWQYQVLRLCFAPCGPERPTAGQGFIIRSPYRKIAPGDDQGLPSSWGALLHLCRVLRPRRDRTHQALAVCPTRPPRCPHRRLAAGSTLEAQSHGLSTGGLRFAVVIAGPHARLASGCWPSSTGWDWLPTRLLRKVSDRCHPPFPSSLGARTLYKKMKNDIAELAWSWCLY
jgi:hypothetical protein